MYANRLCLLQRLRQLSFCWLIGSLAALLLQVPSPAQAARLALVVGNAAYQQSPLKNPVNDARAVDAKLRNLGFAVTKVENLKRDQIGRMLSGFVSRIQPGDEVVVFYAGHGLQVRGENYLPAVDAQINTEDDVPLNSLNLRSVLERLDEAKAGVKLVLLDACRNNPYARSFRSVSRGLARMQDAPSGTLMHFATRPGRVANDGEGANGLYTAELLKLIDLPGVPVEQLFKRVAAAVERASGGQQEPWVEGSLKGDFYFRAGLPQVQQLQPAQVPTRPAPGGLDLGDLQRQAQAEFDAQRGEVAALQRMQADFDAVQQLPGSTRIKAQGWDKFLAAWPAEKVPGEAGRILRQAAQQQQGISWEDSDREAAMAAATLADRARPAGQVFRDCVDCPQMVMVPDGDFQIDESQRGGAGSSDEGQQSNVRVRRFAMGIYEVSQSEWIAVMGNNPSQFRSCGEGCPVERVSWNDAQEFVRRLNQKTGRQYRLPMEAEWEYAARAGTRTSYWWGDKADHDYANYGRDECCDGVARGADRWENTAPKGQFPPNAFGLHDMHGNVWEWTQDCYVIGRGPMSDENSLEAAVARNTCGQRVLRGGSWISSPQGLSSGHRNGSMANSRHGDIGFRLARSAL